MKVLNFIVADDVRYELGNKISLMGIYDESLSFTVQAGTKDEWPKPLRIGFYVRLELENGEGFPSSFQLWSLHNSTKNLLLGGDLVRQSPTNQITIAVVHPMAQLSKGDTEFRVTLLDKNKKELMVAAKKLTVLSGPLPK